MQASVRPNPNKWIGTMNAQCPYCQAECVKDDEAINGLRPVNGAGCEFCNPQATDAEDQDEEDQSQNN